jgi:DNA-binding CsgD family transcriptional regulator
MTLSSTAERRRDAIVEYAGEAESVEELFRGASRRLRNLVPFDAALWLATDPATGLPSAPTLSENFADRAMGGGECIRYWEREFLVEDVNLYRDLGRGETPSAGLRQVTGDRPAGSIRYREFLQPRGFDDELRAVMRVDGRPWAQLSLVRESGRPSFDADEAEFVGGLSGPLAEAIREHARPATDTPPGPDGPGLLLFGPDGELVSANDHSLAWLEELAWLDEWHPSPAEDAPDRFFGAPTGMRLPLVVGSTLMHARAIAEQRDRGAARARLRSRAGRWLVCHASCLRDADGRLGSTALVIEPAKAAEIAPIIVQAYELTAREQEIAGLISRGFGTGEIADSLFLSAHTVRDHVKAIFEKTGVSSRGELVAKLYAEHYAPSHLDPDNIETVVD